MHIVRQILDLWRSGTSYRAIAAKLNENGAPTKQGARWYHGTVARIVHGGSGTKPSEAILEARWIRNLPTPGVSGSQAGGYVRLGVSTTLRAAAASKRWKTRSGRVPRTGPAHWAALSLGVVGHLDAPWSLRPRVIHPPLTPRWVRSGAHAASVRRTRACTPPS